MSATVTSLEARETLAAAVARRDRVIVLTGEPRSGTAVLCRAALEAGGVTASWIEGNATLTFHEILQQFAVELQSGASPPQTADDLALAVSEQELIAFISRAIDTNPRRAAAIVVDNAETLSRFVIGKLQTLADLSSSGRSVTLLLVGQPALDHTIDKPEFAALRQHLTTRLRLRGASEAEGSASKAIAPASTRAALRPARVAAVVGALALIAGIGWAARAIARRPASVRAPIAASAPAAAPPAPAPTRPQPREQPPPAPAAPPAASAPPVASTAPVPSAPPAAVPVNPSARADAGVPSTPEMDARLEQLHQSMEREAIDLASRGDVNALVSLRAKTEAAYANIGARRPDFLAALLGELDTYTTQARAVRRP
jgi:hypothetical protein